MLINTETRYQMWTGGQSFINDITFPYDNLYFYIGCHVSSNIGMEAPKTQDFVSLGQNTPNPCEGTTNISYKLDKNANVQLDIYDIAGRNVMNINEGQKTTGKHSVLVDASRLNDGIYYYTLTANGVRLTKKMMVSK